VNDRFSHKSYRVKIPVLKNK